MVLSTFAIVVVGILDEENIVITIFPFGSESLKTHRCHFWSHTTTPNRQPQIILKTFVSVPRDTRKSAVHRKLLFRALRSDQSLRREERGCVINKFCATFTYVNKLIPLFSYSA